MLTTKESWNGIRESVTLKNKTKQKKMTKNHERGQSLQKSRSKPLSLPLLYHLAPKKFSLPHHLPFSHNSHHPHPLPWVLPCLILSSTLRPSVLPLGVCYSPPCPVLWGGWFSLRSGCLLQGIVALLSLMLSALPSSCPRNNERLMTNI